MKVSALMLVVGGFLVGFSMRHLKARLQGEDICTRRIEALKPQVRRE